MPTADMKAQPIELTPSNARIALAPDERWAAYATAGVDPAGDVIALVDLDSGERRLLTAGWGRSWGPRWSPDGRRLAFYSTRDGEPQLWLWEAGTGEFRRPCATPVNVRFGHELPWFTPDGERIVVCLRSQLWQAPKVDTFEADATARDATTPPREIWESPPPPPVERDDAPTWKARTLADIAVIDLTGGNTRYLVRDEYPWVPALSPDGEYVAAMCFREQSTETGLPVFDLRLWSLDGRIERTLADGVMQDFGTAFNWAPDSERIAYTTFGDGPGQLVVLDLDGRVRLICDGQAVDLGNEEGDPPLWSSDGRTVYCQADRLYAIDVATGEIQALPLPPGRRVWGAERALRAHTVAIGGATEGVLAVTRDASSRRQGIARLRLDGYEWVVPEQSRSLFGLFFSGDAGRRRLVGLTESFVEPATLSVVELTTGELRRLGALAATDEPPTFHDFTFAGPDRTRNGVLIAPAGCELGDAPTAMRLYYGEGQHTRTLEFGGGCDLHRLLRAGYGVLLCDMSLIEGLEPMDAIERIANAAVDAAAAAGLVNSDRIGIYGQSNGGYTVCALLTRTSRFKAAAASASITELTSFALAVRANHMSWLGYAQGQLMRLGGPPWAEPDRYIRNSPVYFADRVTTPLLLLHGTADPVPIQQAEAMYGALRAQHKTACLVRYKGDGHVIGGDDPAQRDDYWARIIGWFDRFVRA